MSYPLDGRSTGTVKVILRLMQCFKETCNSAGCSSYQLIIQYTGSESYAQRMAYTLRTNIWRTSRADFETVVPC